MYRFFTTSVLVTLSVVLVSSAHAGEGKKFVAKTPATTGAALQKVNQVTLNPQPLPPRWVLTTSGSTVSLNPQPLPPKTVGVQRFSSVLLNPQPLPPKVFSRYRR